MQSILYKLLENKAITLAAVSILSFTLRFTLAIQTDSLVESLGTSIEFASIIAAASIAILLYFKDAINNQAVKKISQKNHTTIFGLGEVATKLLEKDIGTKNSYIVYEKDLQSSKIEYFRKQGVGVIGGDVFDADGFSKLNFDNMDYAIISLGNDRLNIELATTIIDFYISKKIESPIKLVVHIINQDLNALFHQKFLSSLEDSRYGKIDIQTFSFYEEVAESFFEQNFIDGQNDTIMKSDNPYHIIVAGDGQLALNIIYQAAKIAHLPNENRLTIHIVDNTASSFKNRVIRKFPGILEVVDLQVKDVDEQTLEFYKNPIWFQENLTHVIVCYDDEEKNLKVTTDLFNKTYISKAIDGLLQPRVNFAMFNAYHISKKIDQDKEGFKQFFSFGNADAICTRENLLDEKHSLLAKLVHKQYAEVYTPHALYDISTKDSVDFKKIHEKWYDATKLSDKLSSKAQTKHMDIKLKALGLKKTKSDKAPKELLTENRKVFDEMLQSDRMALGLSDTFLQEYSKELPKLWKKTSEPIQVQYFPKEYTTLFEKLIRAEHNRWNAYHYLNGWKYSETKSKSKKEHDCLMPLENFIKAKNRLTVLYDIYSILYIPNYLANAGYRIEKRLES